MSRSLYVEFQQQGFWAYDVVSHVFLKHLIEVATAQRRPEEDWLATAFEHWRVNAIVSDYGFFLDDEWSTDQVEVVTDLLKATNKILSCRERIPAEELQSVPIIVGLPIDLRGMQSVPTLSVIKFGEALIQLLNGSLPEPPPGTGWFFGIEE